MTDLKMNRSESCAYEEQEILLSTGRDACHNSFCSWLYILSYLFQELPHERGGDASERDYDSGCGKDRAEAKQQHGTYEYSCL